MTWCAHQSQVFGLTGADLFSHYMRSGSKRGYGKMTPELIDIDSGKARVRVDNSVFVTEMGTNVGRSVCYMFEGAFAGGLASASRTVGLDAEWTADEATLAVLARSRLMSLPPCPENIDRRSEFEKPGLIAEGFGIW